MALMVAVLIAVPLAVTQVVPKSSWERLSTIPNELLRGGNMSNRRVIWRAGLSAFPEHPVVGTGAGTYGAAIAPLGQTIYGPSIAAHNVFIGILVEHGIVGLGLFISLLGACAVNISRMLPNDRKMWAVLMLVWAMGTMSTSLERWKATWMLVGMVAAHHSVVTARQRVAVAAPGMIRTVPDGAAAFHATMGASHRSVARRS
jgi:O-antigen ligase